MSAVSSVTEVVRRLLMAICIGIPVAGAPGAAIGSVAVNTTGPAWWRC